MNDMGIMVVQARDMIGIISWGYDWDMLAFLAILPQVLERVSRGFMTEFLGENWEDGAHFLGELAEEVSIGHFCLAFIYIIIYIYIRDI